MSTSYQQHRGAVEANRRGNGEFGSWQAGQSQATLEPEAPPAEDPIEPEEVEYSFLREFAEAEERFDTEFEGYPTRFFSADLRGKHLGRLGDDDLAMLADRIHGGDTRIGKLIDERRIAGRMAHAVSTPAENQMSGEQAEQLLGELDGVTEVSEVTDQVLLNTLSKNATRGWLARMETTNELGDREERWLAVTDASANRMQPYTLPSGRDPIRPRQQVVQTDLRSLAGAARIESRTGFNPVAESARLPATGSMAVNSGDYPDDDRESGRPMGYDTYKARAEENQRRGDQLRIGTLGALSSLEDAQLEGNNFLAQRKYVRDHTGKVATAWDDKKNPDAAHRELMETTTLAASNGGGFRAVEVDNDVDPEQFADFERAYAEVAEKLPTSGAGRAPQLRIRRLGKHGSATSTVNGMFNPARNTVAIDVHTSEAFVHEMGHHYDLVAQNNASLSEDFKSISRRYSAALDEPDPKRRGYLNTPTEQLARGFEVYAHQRLGIDNRLINPEKFDRADYAPFEDPELRDEMFAFFDRTFEQ